MFYFSIIGLAFFRQAFSVADGIHFRQVGRVHNGILGTLDVGGGSGLQPAPVWVLMTLSLFHLKTSIRQYVHTFINTLCIYL